MPSRLRPLHAPSLLLLVAAAGCQDYNFNPVGHCLIQPGSKSVTLSSISTADVLFVVDDSGSMGGDQAALAANFTTFVANLNQTNADRVAAGLDPIDFHLAVTTTSVFYNAPTTASCRSDCPGAAGSLVCCNTSGGTPLSPLQAVKDCAADTDCTGTDKCRTDCAGFLGEGVCCDPTTKVVTETVAVACQAAGADCGDLQRHYRFASGCVQGVATDGALFPHGGFVGLGTNPRVLHFDKELYPSPPSAGAVNKQGFTSAQLEGWFEQNVVVGTCGSGQEQGLQAGRLAVQKATATPTQQQDTVDATGKPSAGTPAQWPHDASKMVLVFVGDEDDCSSKEDAQAGVILSGAPGADTCVADASLPAAERKQFPVSDLVDSFFALANGRPLGAAFVVSTQSGTCQDDTCTPGQCCSLDCPGSIGVCTRTATCGGQAAGTRFLDAASQLKSRGADVVVGSICGEFGNTLGRIADIVKPPAGLVLPTQPAGSDITQLRITTAQGTTRKTCRGPAPATLDATGARAAGWDWWFTATRDQVTDAQLQPTAPSTFIYINHTTGSCEANPGETYTADYLGRLPASGCQTRADCYAALGGHKASPTDPEIWTCFAGTNADGTFTAPTPAAPGTCVCGDEGSGSF